MRKFKIELNQIGRWKIIAMVATLMALATVPVIMGTVYAGSGSGGGGSDLGQKAEMFLGICPGDPCANGELELDGDMVHASFEGVGFPLDPDQTGRLNFFGLCFEGLFIDDDLVESENRRVVQDDGQVRVDGSVRMTGLDSLLGTQVTMYVGGDLPNGEPRDNICSSAPVILKGTVEFRNLD